MEQAEESLRAEFYSLVPEAVEVAHYAFDGGGKRLRPLVFLLSAASAGAGGHGLPRVAAAIEIIHTASLLHDDVIDGAVMRRGLPPARARWGDRASILVGDLLWCRAAQILLSYGNQKVLDAAYEATAMTAEGQILELRHMCDASTSKEAYQEIIRSKTAALFSLAARAGAIAAGAHKEAEEALATYGADVGEAFQLVDDVLDYVSDEATLGKATGSDLMEGKPTYPLIVALERVSSAEGSLVQKALAEGGGLASQRFGKVRDIIVGCGAIDATLDLARQIVGRAKGHLKVLAASDDRQGLALVAHYVVDRAGQAHSV